MAVAVDDATLPLDNSLSSPASEGAGEFRALKAKINSLFLNTGVGADFTKLITTNNMGINTQISHAADVDLYASKYKITRTANNNRNTYGLWGETVLANGVSVGVGGLISGITSVITTGASGTAGFIYSLNSAVYQQIHNTNATIAGMYLLFANRLTSGGAAPSGLGTNQYNIAASAILIDSFPRSSAAEYCGWKYGIRFTANAFDRDVSGQGYGIDFSQVAFQGGTDPLAAFKFRAAIRLQPYMAIQWDNGEAAMQWYDGSTGRLKISSAGVERWALDVATGQVYKNGVLQY